MHSKNPYDNMILKTCGKKSYVYLTVRKKILFQARLDFNFKIKYYS